MSTISGTYFDGERARGHPIVGEFTADGLLRFSGGGLDREFPLAAVRVSDRLGHVPRFLYLPDGGVLESADNDPIDAALAARRRSRAAGVIHFLETQQRIAAAACLLVVVAVSALVYFGLPVLARTVATGVPPDVDRRIGQTALAAIAPYFTASALRPEERRRVEQQLERLRPAGPRPRLEYRSMNGGLPNAFALPGGMIVVTDELVRLPVDDDELAAVLAHELGHLERRHGVRSLLERSLALLVVAALTGDASTVTSLAATLPITLLTAGYSRDLEREADRFALDLLRARGIPPHAFALVLGKLDDARTALQRNSTYLSTHPATEERTALFGGLSAHDRTLLRSVSIEGSARSALSRGELDPALAHCDRLVALTPTASAHLLRARCHLERDEWPAAEADLQAARAIAPETTEAELLRIELLIRRGERDDAVTAARAFLAREPRHAFARGLLGLALDRPDDHTAALPELTAALALDRVEPRLWYWRGEVRARAGDTTRALADLDNSLGLDPGYNRARLRRGLLRIAQRNDSAALTDLAAMSGPASRTAEYLLQRALAEARTGQLTLALENFDRGLAAGPEANTRLGLLLGRGTAFYRHKRWNDALTDLDAALMLAPDQGGTHLLRATTLRQLGRHEEGFRALERAEAAGAAPDAVLRERAEACFDHGDHPAGFAAADELLAIRKDYSTWRLHGLFQLARGEWAPAAADFAAARQLSRIETDDYNEFFLLLARRRAQQPEKFADFVAIVASWRPGWAKFIGQYLSGQIPAARLLSEAEQGGKPNREERLCEAHFYIGLTQLLAGERPAARASLEQCLATGARHYYEYRLARAELARLGPE